MLPNSSRNVCEWENFPQRLPKYFLTFGHKITTRGQCVVPKKIRDYMRLNPGDKIDFVIRGDGEVFVRPVILDVRELKG